jgi:hypothetical protein
MRSRKNNWACGAIALAALVLGLVVVIPGSAMAKAGGTDRPVTGTASGTARFNVRTNSFAVEFSGTASHAGLYNARSEGSGAFAPDLTFAGTGEASVVAANGDEFDGTTTLTTSSFSPQAFEHTTTSVLTITGGTGRFEDATGTLTSVFDVTPIGLEGFTVIAHVEGTVAGRVSY